VARQRDSTVDSLGLPHSPNPPSSGLRGICTRSVSAVSLPSPAITLRDTEQHQVRDEATAMGVVSCRFDQDLSHLTPAPLTGPYFGQP
jgi:hypothetical protein